MKIWTVLVAAGEGLRFGSKKQLAELAGMPVLLHSTLNASSVSDGIVVVTSADDIDFVRSCLKSIDQVHEIVEGGATRSESVRCGLEKVPHEQERSIILMLFFSLIFTRQLIYIILVKLNEINKKNSRTVAGFFRRFLLKFWRRNC